MAYPYRNGPPNLEVNTIPIWRRTYLDLNRSRDLEVFSRSLGPGVQEKAYTQPSEAIQAQFENHYEQLLRQQQQQQQPQQQYPQPQPQPPPPPIGAISQQQAPLGYQSPVSRPQPAPISRPNSTILTPTPRPPPPQFLSQSHNHGLPIASGATPIATDPTTYPLRLRYLIQSSLHWARDRGGPDDDTDAVYYVIVDFSNGYTGSQSDILGSFNGRHMANMKAAEHFIREFWERGDRPEYDLLDDGSLSLRMRIEGLNRGVVEVFTRRAKMGRG